MWSIVHKTDESEPVSFGDLTSVGDCHEQCRGGCTEPRSATACFSCKALTQTLRNKAVNGFKCVTSCEDTYYLDGDKCKMCSSHCHTCKQAEECETCPGSQLLIDVKSTGQIYHGQCVDKCPENLMPDYKSNLVQARCILREDVCGPGYYINAVGKCSQCDDGCETCTGPSPLSCVICAKGFGNRSVGCCRPCCQSGQKPENGYGHCEDCSASASYPVRGERHNSFFWSFIWIVLLVAVIGAVVYIAIVAFRDEKKQFQYTPLYNSISDKVDLQIDSSDSDDEPFPLRPEV